MLKKPKWLELNLLIAKAAYDANRYFLSCKLSHLLLNRHMVNMIMQFIFNKTSHPKPLPGKTKNYNVSRMVCSRVDPDPHHLNIYKSHLPDAISK